MVKVAQYLMRFTQPIGGGVSSAILSRANIAPSLFYSIITTLIFAQAANAAPSVLVFDAERRVSQHAAVRQAINVLSAESIDADNDGYAEAPSFASGSGPTGGGRIPATSGATKSDGYGFPLGYCVWDNGTTNSSSNRLTGGTSSSAVSLAVISAGLDNIYQTSCANLAAGALQGDDYALWYNATQVASGAVGGGMHWGNPATDVTALNALDTSTLKDGEVRLVKSSNSLYRYTVGTGWQSITSSAGGVWTDDNTNVFLTNTARKVGIGTTTPAEKLEINGGNVIVKHNSLKQFQWQYDSSQPVWSLGGGNYFNLSQGNNIFLKVDGSGNVGIGTSTPDSRLHVVQNIANGRIASFGWNATIPRMTIENGGTDGYAAMLRMWSSSATNYTSADSVRINTLGNSYFNGGNVGIGTTTPATALDVKNSSFSQLRLKGNGHAQELWAGAVWDSIGSFIGNNAYYSNNYYFKPNYTAASGMNFRQDGSTEFWGDTGLTAGTDYIPTKRMVITNAGNIGIGTTLPAAKLHVNGTGIFEGTLAANAGIATSNMNSTGQIAYTGNYGGTATNPALAFTGINYTGGTGIFSPAAHQVAVATNGAQRMVVDAVGNVGIGTTAPVNKFTVQSAAGAGNVVVANINNPYGYGTGVGTAASVLRFNRTPNNAGSTGVMADILGGNEDETTSTAGYLAFATRSGILEATAERMRITSVGNVGIGTTNPGSKLQVTTGVSGDSGLTLSSIAGFAALQSVYNTRAIGVDSNTGKVWITNALGSLDSRATDYTPSARPAGFYMDFRQNGVSGLTDGGSFHSIVTLRGYGNSTDLTGGYPSQLAFTPNGNMWMRTGTSDTTWGNWGKFITSANLAGNAWTLGGNTGTNPSNQYLGTTDPVDLSLRTNNIERIRVMSGGNVGIGTSTPVYKLDVAGQTMATGYMVPNGTGTANWQITRGGTGSNNLYIQDTQAPSNYFMTFDQTGDMGYGLRSVVARQTFVSQGNTYLATSSGNVGIGTSTPTSKLHVVSTGNATAGSKAFQLVGGGDLGSAGGTQYGLYVTQTGARYSDQVGIYGAVDPNLGQFGDHYYGVYGYSPLSTKAYQDASGVYGQVDAASWNYNSMYAVRGVARPGISSFITQFTNMQAGYGGHFTSHGLANSIGVYADAYLDAGADASSVAIPLLVASNGVEKLRVTAAGNVGIGTTSPTEKLHVVGNVLANRLIAYGGGGIATNSAVGGNSLEANTTGSQNTATGKQALAANTIGSNNTADGYMALAANTSGAHNTALGRMALAANTTAGFNTAVGSNAMWVNTTGFQNTAVGGSALTANTTGAVNTALGYNALQANLIGSANTAVGATALFSNTGNNNTAMGYQSMYFNDAGGGNTALGRQAMYNNTSGSNGVALGMYAMYSNTTGGNNVATGNNALYSNTTGSGNVAMGIQSLYNNTTAGNNTAVGTVSLYSNTTGTDNTGLGNKTLYFNTSGNFNSATASFALYNTTTGSYNNASGYQSLYNNTTGNFNVANGASALQDLTTGSSNTAVGYNTGRGITTGSNNTILGANVTGLAAGLSNNIILADGAGNQRINVDASGNVGIGTTAPLQKLDVGTGNIKHGDVLYHTNSFWNQIAWARITTPNNAGDSIFIGAGGNTVIGGGEAADAVRTGFTDGSEGLYLASDYDINFMTALQNGYATRVNAMTIKDTGDVGIGTTAPIAKLDVTANAGSSPILNLYNTNTSDGRATIMFRNDRTSTQQYEFGLDPGGSNAKSFQVRNITAGTYPFTITSAGNIGVGTTAPGQKLEVAGNAVVTGNLMLGSSASGEYIARSSSAPYRLGVFTNSVERMVVDNAGNVGIGTTAPTDKFQVAGNAVFGIAGTAAGTGSITLRADSAAAYAKLGQIGFVRSNYNPNENAAEIQFYRGGAAAEGALAFATQAGVSALTERMRITEGGNVGIGTSSPSAKLDVNGHTRLTTVSQGATATERFYPNVISSAQNTTVTGAWVVHTPIPRTANRMFKIRVHGYWYQAAKIVDFTIVGYPYNAQNGNVDGSAGTVINRDIIDQGTDGLSKYVGVDAAGNVAIALGDVGTSIYYGRLAVDAWITQGTSEFATGWSIDQNTTLGFGWGDISGPMKPSTNNAWSGTANYIPKFNTAGTLTNSALYQDASGKIGIGTNTPSYAKLDIDGGILGANPALAFTVKDGTYNPRVIVSHVATGITQYLQFDSSFSTGSGYANWIFNNGNMGVGTTSPTERLTVGDGTSVSQGIHINAGTYPLIRFQRAGTNKWGIVENYLGGDGLEFYSYGATTPSTKFSISKEGNVAVGSTAASYKLQVNNATTVGTAASALSALNPIAYFDNGSAADGAIVIKSHNVGAGNVHGALRFATSPDSTNYSWSGMAGISSTASAAADTLAFYTSAINSVGAAATERMRIDAAGNVGIGTSAPTSRLHIAGDNVNLFMDGSGNVGTPITELKMKRGAVSYSLRTGIGGNQNFDIYDNTNSASRLYIGATGNVGIGTTAPNTPLDVVGNTTLRNRLSVNGGAFTDNNGNVVAGIKMDTANKTGIYVTDNFAQNSGNNGAFISAVVSNRVNFPSTNAMALTMMAGSTTINTQTGSGYTAVLSNNNATGAVGSGNVFSQIQTNGSGIANTGTSYAYTSYNYMQDNGAGASLSNYVGYYSRGQIALGSPVVTNQYDFRADDFVNSVATGGITNRYGLYLGYGTTQTTNAYGVYQTDANVKNYFNGNVGIGTSAPAAKLHIVSGTGELKFQNVSQNNLYVAGTNASLVLDAISSNYPGVFIKTQGVVNGGITNIGGTLASGIMLTNAAGAGVAVDGSGNVGIGTSAPTTKLDVVGTEKLTAGTYAGANAGHLTLATTDGLGTAYIGLQGTSWGMLGLWGTNRAVTNHPTMGLGNSHVILSVPITEYAQAIRLNPRSDVPQGVLITSGGNIPTVDIKAAVSQTQPLMRFADSTGAVMSVVSATGNLGVGTNTPQAKLHIGNNVATGFLDSYAEYQLLMYNGATVADTYGLGVKSGYMVFNSNGGYSFDRQGAATAMLIDAAGNVGIGTTTPSYLLHVNGTAAATTFTTLSDARYKQNIAPIADAMSLINQLEGVRYDFNRAAFPHMNFTDKRQMGFIAQQIETAVPELVTTDARGYKAVNYSQMSALLVEGLKAHDKIVRQFKQEDAATLAVTSSVFKAKTVLADELGVKKIKVPVIDFENTFVLNDSVANKRRMVITADGKVGFNIENPSVDFEVGGDAKFTAGLAAENINVANNLSAKAINTASLHAGNVRVTGNSMPDNGIYAPQSNSVGIAAGNTLIAKFDAISATFAGDVVMRNSAGVEKKVIDKEGHLYAANLVAMGDNCLGREGAIGRDAEGNLFICK